MSEATTHLTPDALQQYRAAFDGEPRYRLALNAVTKNPVSSIALNRDAVVGVDHTFSHTLKSNDSTSQNRSGRCWMFAGLNVFRNEAMKHLNVDKFELSQNYPMFWDKLEKANYFLESIIETLDEPTNGRLLMHLLQRPIQDGGQWDMFVNLVQKYGVLPKTAMPETDSSSNSGEMNALITAKLRENAAELRRLHRAGESVAALRRCKDEMMAVIYRMLSIHLGKPPESFVWQWRDKDKVFHRAGRITPQEFFRRYVRVDMDTMACLIHCPTADKPMNRMYTIQYLGNVIEGHIIRYLNVAMPIFKQAAIDMIKDGQVVWFGCDVGKMLERDLGILDMTLYDYESVYGTRYTADKAERIDHGQSLMTHAMVLTGVDLDDRGQPVKWRIENSWGDKIGDKGFLTATDAWFDEYMYEVVVDKRFIPADLHAVLETAPTVLPPWDPMGSLAAAE